MRLVPILDTSVFLDAASEIISPSDWKTFRRSLPKSGCPLSAVTLGELLTGLARCSPEMFSQAQQALRLARSVSRGRVLPQPRSFAWENILHTPSPYVGVDARQLRMWLESACVAKTKEDLVESKLPDRRALRRGRRCMGLDLVGIASDTFADQAGYVKATQHALQWISSQATESQTDPRARISGRLAERLKHTYGRADWNRRVAESFLEGSGLEPTDERLASLARRLEAAFTLETALARLTLLGTYHFNENPSDWFDCLQLYYLARDGYCAVTQDKRLTKRIEGCAQSQRVFTFDSFIASL